MTVHDLHDGILNTRFLMQLTGEISHDNRLVSHPVIHKDIVTGPSCLSFLDRRLSRCAQTGDFLKVMALMRYGRIRSFVNGVWGFALNSVTHITNDTLFFVR